MFYIPSFVSTSKNPNKAFPNKNVLMKIDLSEFSDYSGLILPEESDYKEEECLISCYNIYQFIGYDPENSVLTLKIKNYYHYNDESKNEIRYNEDSKDITDVVDMNIVSEDYFIKTHSKEKLISLMKTIQNQTFFKIQKN